MIAHDSQLLDSTVARQRHRRCQKAQNDAFVTDLGLPLDQAPERLEFAYCFPISAHQKLIMLTRQHFALDNDIHTAQMLQFFQLRIVIGTLQTPSSPQNDHFLNSAAM
ncbi:hypothetical protein D3C84_969590 [compost metagenome]